MKFAGSLKAALRQTVELCENCKTFELMTRRRSLGCIFGKEVQDDSIAVLGQIVPDSATRSRSPAESTATTTARRPPATRRPSPTSLRFPARPSTGRRQNPASPRQFAWGWQRWPPRCRDRMARPPATAGPALAEPFALFARFSNTSCVPAPNDEDGHPWLGLRGLRFCCIHNLRAKLVFFSRPISTRATLRPRTH